MFSRKRGLWVDTDTVKLTANADLQIPLCTLEGTLGIDAFARICAVINPCVGFVGASLEGQGLLSAEFEVGPHISPKLTVAAQLGGLVELGFAGPLICKSLNSLSKRD